MLKKLVSLSLVTTLACGAQGHLSYGLESKNITTNYLSRAYGLKPNIDEKIEAILVKQNEMQAKLENDNKLLQKQVEKLAKKQDESEKSKKGFWLGNRLKNVINCVSELALFVGIFGASVAAAVGIKTLIDAPSKCNADENCRNFIDKISWDAFKTTLKEFSDKITNSLLNNFLSIPLSPAG